MRLLGSERKPEGLELTVILMPEDLARAHVLEFTLTTPGRYPCSLKKWVRPKTTTENEPSTSGEQRRTSATIKETEKLIEEARAKIPVTKKEGATKLTDETHNGLDTKTTDKTKIRPPTEPATRQAKRPKTRPPTGLRTRRSRRTQRRQTPQRAFTTTLSRSVR